MNERLKALADAGVSIWLDDLSRERIVSGNLADLVSNYSVSGVTTNPTIFAAALAQGHAYDEQIQELAARDAELHDAIKVLTTDDVRNACDIMADTFKATNGVDGRMAKWRPGTAFPRTTMRPSRNTSHNAWSPARAAPTTGAPGGARGPARSAASPKWYTLPSQPTSQ